jgi:hypothetical protein
MATAMMMMLELPNRTRERPCGAQRRRPAPPSPDHFTHTYSVIRTFRLYYLCFDRFLNPHS